MGVRRLFSRGGQNFPGEGGAKTYYLPKRHLETYYFPLKKVKKHTILAGQGGQGPLLSSPADAHDLDLEFVKKNLNLPTVQLPSLTTSNR